MKAADGLRPAHPLSFFDPEHVERPVPARPWRTIVFSALLAVAVLVAAWEIYWRGKSLDAGDFANSSALWADQRRRAVGDATVLIGSSRILFDIDLDVWEQKTGVRPVQLALEGTSPRVFLKDLAEDEKFRGLVIVGVTTVLFFTMDGGLRADVIDYTKNQTLSQRADHWLSTWLERAFAFIDPQTAPKRQMILAPLPLREGMPPRFDPRKLSVSAIDRNTEMWRRVVDDPAYQQEAKDQWLVGIKVLAPPPQPDGSPPPPMPDEAIDAIITEVNANIAKIRARGGDVAFLRLPYEGPFAQVEDAAFPRERFWDRLLEKTDSVGVTFHDHLELQGYIIPEWSHLAPREAERYTAALAPIFLSEMGKKASRRPAQ